jgi:protease-4
MTDSASPDPQSNWEKQAMQTVMLEHIKDQRSARRWTALYRMTILGIIGFIFFYALKWDPHSSSSSILQQSHTAVIDIRGPIDADQPASADNINSALDMAYDSKLVKGVILRINSPGGSPVQARQIYDKIQSLQNKNDKVKVYALIEDLGTSAAYLIAASAAEIHADKTSIVGSIGVIMEGFGFPDAMKKLGVERRLYTAGKNKAMLDPFSPQNPEQEIFIKQELDMVHQAFIQNVRDGRKDRLKEIPDIFSGLFWSGEHALSLGLIDGHKNAGEIAKELIKAENMVDYTPGISVIDRIANRIGASLQGIDLQSLATKHQRLNF